jgi:hypothetical protein
MATRKLLPHEGIREANKEDALVILAKMQQVKHPIVEDAAQRLAHILWEEGFVILEKE